MCLKKIPADLERIGGKEGIWLSKTCPEHGHFSVPVWRDRFDFNEWTEGETPLSFEEYDFCSGDCHSCPSHLQDCCCVILEEWLDGRTVRCRYGHPAACGFDRWAEPGDEIAFIDRRSMALLGTARAASFFPTDERTFLLSFDAAPPEEIRSAEMRVLEERVSVTPDLGGTGTTSSMGEAICRAVTEASDS